MIPRSQHLRDRAPFPFEWSGILRVLEQPFFEGFLGPAQRRAHYAGEQANASIENGERGRLSAGEDDVAERDLLDLRTRLEQALVEALEAAAEDGHAGARRELADALLRDQRAARCHG